MAGHQLWISDKVHAVLGLDDMARYADITRVPIARGFYCRGTHEALTDLVTEIHDRATEDGTGFNESKGNKSACRAVLRGLRGAGWEPRR